MLIRTLGLFAATAVAELLGCYLGRIGKTEKIGR